MVEAVPSMEPIQPDEALQAVWLNTEAKILGWDIGRAHQIIESDEAQEMADVNTKLQAMLRQYLHSSHTEDKTQVKQELARIAPILQEENVQAYLKKTPITSSMQKTVDARTDSMIRSLKEASGKFSRRFVIAGANHLVVNDQAGFEYSLDHLYDFMRSRKFVVLIPDGDQFLKLGKEWEDQLTELLSS